MGTKRGTKGTKWEPKGGTKGTKWGPKGTKWVPKLGPGTPWAWGPLGRA